jgi:hypothetical protein
MTWVCANAISARVRLRSRSCLHRSAYCVTSSSVRFRLYFLKGFEPNALNLPRARIGFRFRGFRRF